MPPAALVNATDVIRDHAHELTGSSSDFDPLIDKIGDAPFVLIGEATHGTHEFYEIRAAITRRLIEEKGFNAVCAEADWPDAYRAHRYARGRSNDHTAEEALGDFQRFPTWMWRNTVVRDFLEWLRTHNSGRTPDGQCGFYGIDLYSLYSSMDAVIRYLDEVDPGAARRARDRYACFEQFHDDPQRYGYAASFSLGADCEDQVLQQLMDLRRGAQAYLARDGFVAADEQFYAEQNALVARNAEQYYRQMFAGRVDTWNLRDSHMADTIDALANHMKRQGITPRIVVWEHNSHLGDARATYMSSIGEHNVGQLMRERHGEKAYLIGFTTHSGTVSAADDWDQPVQRMRVRPALERSYEDLFHQSGVDRFLLDLRTPDVAEALAGPLLERAIGVVYRPRTERSSHYFDCRLPQQFDAVMHIDRTTALEPLDPTRQWHEGEGGDVPETYPFGV